VTQAIRSATTPATRVRGRSTPQATTAPGQHGETARPVRTRTSSAEHETRT